MKSAIILAAGKGTRMNSDIPKVMHKVCDQEMLSHIVNNCKKANVQRVVTVVGYGKDLIMDTMKDRCEYAHQDVQLGTGHAVMMADTLSKEQGYTLVINGDCPCIQTETFEELLKACEGVEMVVLTAIVDDARTYGRVIRNEDQSVNRIVEYKDCNEQEKLVKEINTGIYCFNNQTLFDNLKNIQSNNAQNEFYITDLVEIINGKNLKVDALVAKCNEEVAGVNDRYELSLANSWLQMKINKNHMINGVTIMDPHNTYIGTDVTFGKDVIVYPNSHFIGNTHVGDNSTILANSYISNSKIGCSTTIDSSRITDSVVGDEVSVGPNAHLRMNSIVENKNRIGNFVELKNCKMGYNSRCAHLTYLGDCEIGANVNIGCGVVTVNYDGKKKFRTVVKDGAFIGSNVNMIAPVVVGENAVVAAGSTITKDVPKGDMAIARQRQDNLEGYGFKYKNK